MQNITKIHTLFRTKPSILLPCLGQSWAKLHTLFKTERTKTTPCPAAHPRIGVIRKYPPRWVGGEEKLLNHTRIRTIKLKAPGRGENVKKKSYRKPKEVGEGRKGGGGRGTKGKT